MTRDQAFLFYLLLSLSLTSASSPLQVPFTSGQGLNFVGVGGFGYSARNAGDVNGDGVDDVIIGAPNAYSNNGAVYVIYGSTTGLTDLDASSLVTLSSNNKGFEIKGSTAGYLGFIVGPVGDINHDGIDDIAVAMKNQYVFIIYGKRTGLANMVIGASISGTQGSNIQLTSGNAIGTVDYAGDINHDTIDDLVIVNWNINNVYVIYGKAGGIGDISISSSPNTNLVSSNQGFTIYGTSMTYSAAVYLGDVNGDSIDDLLLGSQGFATVIYGSQSTINDFTVTSSSVDLAGKGFIITSSLANFGRVVSGAGDVNGDGVNDILIAAHTATVSANSNAGYAMVIYGRKTTSFSSFDLGSSLTYSSTGQGFAITGGVANGFFGIGLRSGGDFNGDGIDDIVIKADGSTSMAIYIIYGSKSGLSDISQITTDTFNSSSKGLVITAAAVSATVTPASLGYAGDFNGDGGQDILFGITDTSSVYVLFGTPPPKIPEQQIEIEVDTTTKAVSTVLNGATVAVTAATKSVGAANFMNPAAMMLMSMFEGFYFIKYLNINYPPKLAYVLQNYQKSDLIPIDISLLNPPQTVVDSLENQTLPSKFQNTIASDGFYSSFLINFWSDLLILLIILFIIIITSCFIIFTRSTASSTAGKFKRILRWICIKLGQGLKWNLVISIFTGYYQDISVFSYLEFKTVQFSLGGLEIFSFLLCILVNVGIFAVQLSMLIVSYKLHSAKVQAVQAKNPESIKTAKEKLENFQVVFESFKESTFCQQNFLFFINLRMYAYYAIILWFDFTVFQTLLNTGLGMIMLLYLIISRPVREKIDFAQFLLTELIFEMINTCTLGLALMDFYNIGSEESRIALGNAIINCNMAAMVAAMLFSIIGILGILKTIFDFIRRIYANRRLKKKKQTRIRLLPNNLLNESVNLNLEDSPYIINRDQLNPKNIRGMQLKRLELPFDDNSPTSKFVKIKRIPHISESPSDITRTRVRIRLYQNNLPNESVNLDVEASSYIINRDQHNPKNIRGMHLKRLELPLDDNSTTTHKKIKRIPPISESPSDIISTSRDSKRLGQSQMQSLGQKRRRRNEPHQT